MSEVSCKQCGKLESNYLLSIIFIPKAISFCSTTCLVNFIEHKNDHIPDIGKMVEPTTEESSEIEYIDGGEIDIKKLNLATEKQCINLINHSLQKIKDKKLKPVDENCLYKPVMLCGLKMWLSSCDEWIPASPNKFTLLKIKDGIHLYRKGVFCDKLKDGEYLERIADYDYGDGGNHE